MANYQLKRYRNSEYYEKFLSENNYNHIEFEKKDEKEQATELRKFFKVKEWKLKREEKTFDALNVLIIKITNSSKCGDSEKIELIKKANELKKKKEKLFKLSEDIKRLKNEIEDTEKRIKSIIE